MAFTANQQIFELVRKNNSFLIAIKRDWSGDALAASLVLAIVLKKLGKKVDIACDSFKTPANLGFLPTYEIKDHLANLQKFVISLNTTRAKLGAVPGEGDLPPDSAQALSRAALAATIRNPRKCGPARLLICKRKRWRQCV